LARKSSRGADFVDRQQKAGFLLAATVGGREKIRAERTSLTASKKRGFCWLRLSVGREKIRAEPRFFLAAAGCNQRRPGA
jgi:hypothetical protein